MKTLFTALAVSLLAVSAASASGIAASGDTTQRTVELTNARQIHEAGSSSITVTVGAPKEVSATLLPTRERVEAGYKADATLTVSAFPSVEGTVDNRR